MARQSVYLSYFGNLAKETQIDISKFSDMVERFVLDVETGKISIKKTSAIVSQLTKWQNTSQLGANLYRLGWLLYDMFEELPYIDSSSGDYCREFYQDSLSELLRILSDLRQSGWAPTLPVLKLYFHQLDDDGKIIASAATTLYFDEGRISWFDGQVDIMKKLKALAKGCQSLKQLGEFANQHKFGKYKLVEQDLKILLREDVFNY